MTGPLFDPMICKLSELWLRPVGTFKTITKVSWGWYGSCFELDRYNFKDWESHTKCSESTTPQLKANQTHSPQTYST
jgi:hypothetical protein